ncbi:hypothetical protein ZIOFF_064519 [Zingiber officinale]|uniref:dCTP pyrophosphatase 1 n=1 Tax=Zingiber officinale TaxID=94328 RepID=A0A8J5EW13_ZINOF|nr:hypothetical protein ZIOFF_064519 [Zingiber officinale]
MNAIHCLLYSADPRKGPREEEEYCRNQRAIEGSIFLPSNDRKGGCNPRELEEENGRFCKGEGLGAIPQPQKPPPCSGTLVGEVGELSEIFQWKGEVAKGLPDWGEEEKQHLGEELSDVLLYLVRLSDMCGVDLGEAALRKLDLNAAKYPVHLCKASSMKRTYNYSGANENPQSGGAPEGSEL